MGSGILFIAREKQRKSRNGKEDGKSPVGHFSWRYYHDVHVELSVDVQSRDKRTGSESGQES